MHNKSTTSRYDQSGFAHVLILAVGVIVVIGIIGTAVVVQYNNHLQHMQALNRAATDAKTKSLNIQSGIGSQPSSSANPIATESKPNPTAPPPVTNTTPPNATNPPAIPAETASILYRILPDGNSAQVSPVTTAFNNTTSIKILINLTCMGTCQFKLVSDNYTLSNATTYTSSQSITYTVATPGKYVFYNQYTPSTKFAISF